jgi:hypothetical protein
MQIEFQIWLSLRQSSPTSHLVACQEWIFMKVVMCTWWLMCFFQPRPLRGRGDATSRDYIDFLGCGTSQLGN